MVYRFAILKVTGSNPVGRAKETPVNRGFLASRTDSVGNRNRRSPAESLAESAETGGATNA